MRVLALAAGGLVYASLSAAAAGSHIGVAPGLLVAGDTQTLRLSVHNDLGRPMTGLTVRAPAGLRIVTASADGPWQDVIESGAENGAESGTVTWSGGPLAPNTGATFALDVAVADTAAPGPVQIQADQLYANDGRLPWPISVTVVPAEEDSQLVTWAIVGGALLVATGGVALVARRRTGSG